MKKIPKEERIHYVNNSDFRDAVVAYTVACKDAEASDEELPTVTHYIGECFIKIAEGLSHKSNFAYYSYREEMVLNAIENCLRAIRNYDPTKATRSGKPNAFGYFTQICFFAFLRTIAKEKRQQEIKVNLMESGNLGDFADFGSNSPNGDGIVDRIRSKSETLKQRKQDIFEMTKKAKRKSNRSSIESFLS